MVRCYLDDFLPEQTLKLRTNSNHLGDTRAVVPSVSVQSVVGRSMLKKEETLDTSSKLTSVIKVKQLTI